ncbi:uroporphyrinogen-III C-methyltransferase [Synechococcales cyanobacterium C]|uniref:uroporphyrinogen-III C-methyltransferase n=2 Tax=Petrachloros TaxID=2918834 RepID=A0A8K2A8Y5_9CYAN|nr:uroporphyrinogen-III C-methyltransferase [Petrachloros mirabilis]NCJ08539.1 uroporphyrinogen-III C-methyltransferase [Petrachloros mirabilis ULC683]
MQHCQGQVFIVGAGPGHGAYLTLMGLRLLRQADVIIYDALIDAQLLTLLPKNCLHIPVGKRGGKPSVPQSHINQLLVEHCQQGSWVVRLKSGDPLIFGRTASELRALQAARCPCTVVPGLSTALAAPALAGIPLTDASLGAGFGVVSGHAPQQWDWGALSQLPTLVILMGSKTLPQIVQSLQEQGKSQDTPMAIIHWAGQARQQVWISTLGKCVEAMAGSSVSPAVMVVGEVVHLRDQFQAAVPILDFDLIPAVLEEKCFDISAQTRGSRVMTLDLDLKTPRPFQGKTILVTRAASQSSDFCDRLQRLGAVVLEQPALEIVPPSSWEPLDAAIAALGEFHWLILTSANGVEYFMNRLIAQGKDARSLSSVRLAAVGRKTAATLETKGLRPDFIPPEFVADALIENFPGGADLSGTRILFPRVGSGGRDILVSQLEAKGATVVEVPAYQSQCPETLDPEVMAALENQTLDIITFASSKTVHNFCHLLEQAWGNSDWQANLKQVLLASIGPQTSKACIAQLGRVDIEAQEYTLDGLIETMGQFLCAASQ